MKLPSLFVNGRQAFEYFQQHMLPFVQTVGTVGDEPADIQDNFLLLNGRPHMVADGVN